MQEIKSNTQVDWGRFYDRLSNEVKGEIQDGAMLHKLATSREPFDPQDGVNAAGGQDVRSRLPSGSVLVTRDDIVRFLEHVAAEQAGVKPHQVPTAPTEPELPPQRRDLPEVPQSHWRAGELGDWLLRSYPENHTDLFKADNEIAKPAGDLQEILRYRGSILDTADISLVIDKNDPTKLWFKKEEFWTGEVKYYGDGKKPYDASVLPWELGF